MGGREATRNSLELGPLCRGFHVRPRKRHSSAPWMRRPTQPGTTKTFVWGFFRQEKPSLVRDLPIFLTAFSIFYAFVATTRYWLTPISSHAEIDLRFGALPAYAMFSIIRD